MNKNIKIISGWSNTGGSTEAFINLTNSLNSLEYNTVFYGPHSYHLDKCKSNTIQNLNINKNDILICHFLNPAKRPECKKIILNCHEKDMFKVSQASKFYDIVVFLNEDQRKYHNFTDTYTIIPNLKQKFDIIDKKELDNVAGIIGTIDVNKQTHVSIQRAIEDKCDKIFIFGEIRDYTYYNEYVDPLLNDKIEYIGYIRNKQELYNKIGRVYHSSISEVASLVKDECYSTNTKFFGSASTNNEVSILSNEEILKKWIKLFEE